jgi:membrane protein
MSIVSKITAWANTFQQRHAPLGFIFAVIKKFGDDNGGYQAALLTYYGFLSLFPLLLVLVTILHLVFANNADLQAQILANISAYFPLLGDQLTESVGDTGKTGIGLLIGLLVTLYGARGAADALRFALDNMWNIRKLKRSGFPKGIVKSLSIIGVGGLSFLATAVVSAATLGFGRAGWVKVVIGILGFAILTGALTTIFHIAPSKRPSIPSVVPGAILAGAIIQLLLTFGSLIIAHQLKNLDTLYGTFAIVLGLLFWIYLLAQVVVYAAEVNTVRAMHLWPRSLDAKQPTEADKRTYREEAETETYIDQQDVNVSYKK